MNALDVAIRRFPHRLNRCRARSEDWTEIIRPVLGAIIIEYRLVLAERARLEAKQAAASTIGAPGTQVPPQPIRRP